MSLDDERRAVIDTIAQLERRMDGSDRALHALETVPGLLSSLDKRLDAIDRRLDDGERRMTAIEGGLAANTSITTSVRDAQIAGKALSGAVKWVAAMILALGVIWGQVGAFFHPPNLPPGAGK